MNNRRAFRVLGWVALVVAVGDLGLIVLALVHNGDGAGLKEAAIFGIVFQGVAAIAFTFIGLAFLWLARRTD